MRRSARNSVTYGLISAAISWVTSFVGIMFLSRFIPANDISLSPGLYLGWEVALIYASLVGLSAGLTVFLLCGGIVGIRHLLLRYLL